MALTPTRTHHVYNPTASAVTVNVDGNNTVNAHSTAILTLSDADAASFGAAGCKLAQLMPGTADAAHQIGYQHG
jgi:hypothetical protein